MPPYAKRRECQTARRGLRSLISCTGSAGRSASRRLEGASGIRRNRQIESALNLFGLSHFILAKSHAKKLVASIDTERDLCHHENRFHSRFLLTRWGGLTSPPTCGCSSTAEHLASNQRTAVRFRPAAPPNGFSDFPFGSFRFSICLGRKRGSAVLHRVAGAIPVAICWCSSVGRALCTGSSVAGSSPATSTRP